MRYELALLYVAVTRTRSTLLAWDGEQAAPVWDAPGVAPLVFRTADLGRLSELWKTSSSPAEWEAEGDYFFERERFAAARECYRNAGAEKKQELAAARVLEADGENEEAAELYERNGEPPRAAACWERAAQWGRAERAWRAAGDPRRARTCEARLAESQGRLEHAALAWQELGDTARAEALWLKAGAFDRLARAAQEAGAFARAAELFERARLSRDAAAAWERAGELERAGDLWLRLGDHARAAGLYRRAGNDEKLLRCLRHLGDHREAALLYEKRGEIEKAVDAFAAAAAASETARRRLESELPEAKTRRTALKAGTRLAALGRDAEAAPLFLRGGALDAAARRYERLGDHAGLAACHEAAGRWRDAARELGMAEAPAASEPDRASRIQHLLYRHLETAHEQGRDEQEVESLVREAERLIDQGNLVAALARVRLCGVVEGVAQISRRLGWHEDALDWLLEARHPSRALRYVKEGGFDVSVEMFDRLAEKHGDADRAIMEDHAAREETFLHLLSAAVTALPPEEAERRVEAFFSTTSGRMMFFDTIGEVGMELLVRNRACTALMRLLSTELRIGREQSRQMDEFGQRLARAAAETGDPRLAACDAYFQDVCHRGRPRGAVRARNRAPRARAADVRHPRPQPRAVPRSGRRPHGRGRGR